MEPSLRRVRKLLEARSGRALPDAALRAASRKSGAARNAAAAPAGRQREAVRCARRTALVSSHFTCRHGAPRPHFEWGRWGRPGRTARAPPAGASRTWQRAGLASADNGAEAPAALSHSALRAQRRARLRVALPGRPGRAACGARGAAAAACQQVARAV